jgi:hypothetical protein
MKKCLMSDFFNVWFIQGVFPGRYNVEKETADKCWFSFLQI